MLRTDWHGDLAGAKSALQAWPGWLLSEDRGAIFAWKLWFWSKEYDNALAAAQRIQRDYLRDTFFIGPRAVLTARVHEAAHHEDAARSDWRTVQQICDRELTVAPTDFCASYWKAWALARLGDTAGAQAICAQMQQRNQLRVVVDSHGVIGRYDAPYTGGFGIAPLWAVVGRPELALDELGSNQSNFDRFPVTRAMLEKDPAYDSLRGNLRFKEIVSAALAPEEKQASNTLGASAPAVSEKSLVVLPLENLSPDPEIAFFTDGMHAEINSTLSQIGGLKVISRNSALAFKGSTAPLAEIAQKLGVANVLTGSVRRAGNTVRIQLELRRASDEALLWSLPKGDRNLKDVLGLQSEVADQVARVLQARGEKGKDAGARFLSTNPQAFDLYLKAFTIYNANPSNRALIEQCLAMMEEALRLDPALMTAARLAGRMATRLCLIADTPEEQARNAAAAKKWSEQASRLMPGGAGDGALAFYLSQVEGDDLRALSTAENTIRALPNDVEGYHTAAIALRNMGRLEEAANRWAQTEALDIDGVPSWGNHITVLTNLRRKQACEEVIAQFLRVKSGVTVGFSNESAVRVSRYSLDGVLPESVDQISSATERAIWLWRARRFDPLLALCNAQLAAQAKGITRFTWLRWKTDALLRLERKDEAVRIARDALVVAQELRVDPKIGPPSFNGRLAAAFSRCGQADEALAQARAHVEAIPEVSRARRWTREIELAELYAFLGRKSDCTELIARLLLVPSGLTVPMVKVDPAWDNMREDAEFKALLADPKNSAPL